MGDNEREDATKDSQQLQARSPIWQPFARPAETGAHDRPDLSRAAVLKKWIERVKEEAIVSKKEGKRDPMSACCLCFFDSIRPQHKRGISLVQQESHALCGTGDRLAWNRHYEAGERPTALKLKKQFNQIRREQFPWTWAVTKNASDQPFLDLGQAFTAFFEGRARRPKFKSKKRSKPGFYLANDQFELGDHRLWVPKRGWVNMAENVRFKGKVTGARITRTADWGFVTIGVEMPEEIPVKKPAACGIDVGLNRLATLSTGEGIENQAFLKTALKKLRRANKRLHRRKLGSKNREKARKQVARLH